MERNRSRLKLHSLSAYARSLHPTAAISMRYASPKSETDEELEQQKVDVTPSLKKSNFNILLFA
jgi:hypothetical protein